VKASLFWWGLAAFFFLALGFWFGFLQIVGDWLWHLLHGLSRV